MKSATRAKVFLLFSCLLLVGCAAKRVITRTDQTLQLEQTTASRLQVSDTSRVVTTVTMGATDNTETVTEVIDYDTSLPVDLQTATPPIRRRTVQTQRHVSELQQQATTQAQRQTTIEQLDTTRASIQEHTTVQEQSRRGMSWWQSTLCTIGILSLIALVLWIIFKLIKRRLSVI